MFSPLRNRFGIPGAISVIALVFAMLGGAYAANNDNGGGKATASAKGKPGPRGPRGKTGPAGPAGPVGPAGANGAKGDTGGAGSNGKDGTNGTNGTNGTSATTATFAGTKGSCTEGGVEVKSASPAALVCNGKKGQQGEPGPLLETLPKGETLIGVWAATVGALEFAAAPISFPFPLSNSTPVTGGFHYIAEGKEGEVFAEECPGSATEPEAKEGNTCVYTLNVAGSLGPTASGIASGTGGVTAFFSGGVPGSVGFGSWAVTSN